jgi:hypothetical protein
MAAYSIREEIMKRPAGLFPIVLTLGAIILAPQVGAQDSRPEGPIEIEKCQTISKPGSYRLVNNLTFAGTGNTSCLTITADFVSIDLSGFTITGPARGAAIGAQPPSSLQMLQGIAVRNGSISGINTGVALVNLAAGSVVEGLRVVGGNDVGSNLSGLGIDADGIVKDNTVIGFSTGISGNGLIAGNYVSNSGNAFSIGGSGGGSLVIGNAATLSQAGFFVNCPANVTNNTALFNVISNLELGGTGCNNTNNVAP